MPETVTTWQVWPCSACGKVARTVPESPTQCRCAHPVLPLKPKLVTESQVEVPQARRLQALTEEEGRLRDLAREGTRVRLTFDAEVVGTLLATGMDGRTTLSLTVATADGHRHPVNLDLPGLHIEAIPT